MKQLVITLTGKDRPGLIELVSHIVLQHKGTWHASSLTNLSGQYAGILHICVPSSQVAALYDALSSITESQMHLVEVNKPNLCRAQHKLTITGSERPGIINKIATKLASMGINISKLETITKSNPKLFVAILELELPDIELMHVQESLAVLTDDLTIKLSKTEEDTI